MSFYTQFVTPELIDEIGKEVRKRIPDCTYEELEKAIKASYESPNVYGYEVTIHRIGDSILLDRRKRGEIK